MILQRDLPTKEEIINLVRRLKGGDLTALYEIVEIYRMRMIFFIRRFGLSPEDAEEIAQNLFCKAYWHIDELKEDDSFGYWIHTIAANMAKDWLRKNRMRLKLIESLDALPSQIRESFVSTDNPAQQVEVEDLKKKIEKVAEKFTLNQKKIWPYLKRGIDYGEISILTGIPENSVRAEVSKIKKLIVEALYS